MRGVESPADLLHDTHSFDRGKFSPFPQQRFQIAALDIFHGEKLHPIGLAKVVDPDHVLVRNLPRQDQFLLEALENRRGVREFRTNDFQSDQAIEFAVLGLVNRSHATFAQQMKDLVCRLLLEKKNNKQPKAITTTKNDSRTTERLHR